MYCVDAQSENMFFIWKVLSSERVGRKKGEIKRSQMWCGLTWQSTLVLIELGPTQSHLLPPPIHHPQPMVVCPWSHGLWPRTPLPVLQSVNMPHYCSKPWIQVFVTHMAHLWESCPCFISLWPMSYSMQLKWWDPISIVEEWSGSSVSHETFAIPWSWGVYLVFDSQKV